MPEVAQPVKVTVHKREINGAVFDIAQHHKPCIATVCIGQKRLVLRGFVALKAITKRYKFPDELVMTLLSAKTEPVKEELRNPSDWNSVEIYLPLEDADELLEKASSAAALAMARSMVSESKGSGSSCV